MILVVQRVKSASVNVGGECVGSCGKGLMMLIGVADGDGRYEAELLAKKVLGLRIFTDENDKMNLSLRDVEGEALVVSNFTLLANYRKGNRPDYMGAAKPDVARELYEYFAELISKELSHVGMGAFGEHMEIDMRADGPVTIVMDSAVLSQKK
ncbi:MAG: D-tyrosyl-tRNA(Tyr) deacylase [Ruminococcaceae bacterium]|nr:D-tyrosyl-tRNA(Tyr) deacylase [Oscillospiraceae bacterium]